jgi:arylsulfatase A-like enzyme
MLFVNVSETHVPYDFGDAIDPEVKDILDRARLLWGGKRYNEHRVRIAPEEFARLHQAQIQAVEAVDTKIGELLSALTGPVMLVVCGDHGEAFGEDGLYGHGFPHPAVIEVPLIVGFIEE